MINNLENIANQARQDLSALDAAREKMLPLCREVIRSSSTAIRAVHRQDYTLAEQLINTGKSQLIAAEEAAAGYKELSATGAVKDAQKELAEANITLAIATGKALPGPQELGAEASAYLNGMGEAAGEVRRFLLDAMRKGDLSRGEELLTIMDDIYSVLVTLDFPDAVTGGLRRTTDMVRGVLERTRADLTLAIQQKALETKLSKFTSEPLTAGEPVIDGEGELPAAPTLSEQELNPIEQEIYNALAEWRTRKSIEDRVAPYIIAHNSVLKEIVKLRPTTARELGAIRSLGERRINKYGKEIIAIVNKEY
jgi:translin